MKQRNFGDGKVVRKSCFCCLHGIDSLVEPRRSVTYQKLDPPEFYSKI
ncbi:hypothetical protein [Microseira wollei]|nr:hypothetical protein [Microseira wollei]